MRYRYQLFSERENWCHCDDTSSLVFDWAQVCCPPPANVFSPLGYCSSHIFHSGFAMERTSEFPQVCYYRYLDLCSTRHWYSKLGTSTWSILWCYGILYVFYGFLTLKSVYLILLGCWILPQYQAERIVTEYVWVWLAGLFMIILYGLIFAIIRRWINIAHGIRWHDQPHGDALDMDSDDDKKIKAVANSMLLLVYCFLFVL